MRREEGEEGRGKGRGDVCAHRRRCCSEAPSAEADWHARAKEAPTRDTVRAAARAKALRRSAGDLGCGRLSTRYAHSPRRHAPAARPRRPRRRPRERRGERRRGREHAAPPPAASAAAATRQTGASQPRHLQVHASASQAAPGWLRDALRRATGTLSTAAIGRVLSLQSSSCTRGAPRWRTYDGTTRRCRGLLEGATAWLGRSSVVGDHRTRARRWSSPCSRSRHAPPPGLPRLLTACASCACALHRPRPRSCS